MLSLRLVRLPQRVAREVLLGGSRARDVLSKEENESGQWFNLGNTWAGVHFVLSGEFPVTKDRAFELGISFRVDQLENILMGGVVVDVPSDFGAVRYMDPKEVSDNWRMLSGVDLEMFRDRYSALDLEREEVPPSGWIEEPEREGLMVETYGEIIEFYSDAVEEGHGMFFEFVSSGDE